MNQKAKIVFIKALHSIPASKTMILQKIFADQIFFQKKKKTNQQVL